MDVAFRFLGLHLENLLVLDQGALTFHNHNGLVNIQWKQKKRNRIHHLPSIEKLLNSVSPYRPKKKSNGIKLKMSLYCIMQGQMVGIA